MTIIEAHMYKFEIVGNEIIDYPRERKRKGNQYVVLTALEVEHMLNV